MGAYAFGYDSALAIMRYLPKQVARAHKVELDLRETTCEVGELRERGWLDWLNGKVHLLVDSSHDRRHTCHVESHKWGTHCHYWPMLRLGEDIYMSTPEFLFLQAANSLDELSLVFLGCEICGRYSFDGTGCIVKRPLLCSAKSVERFLHEHRNARGAIKAQRALAKVLDNSASPMETELALRLTLPCKDGGRGIAMPALNKTVQLGRLATMALGRDAITPDLLWEESKFAAEYESNEHHTGTDRIVGDSRRRLALEAEGYDVVTVTNEQMRRARDFDAIAEHIAHKTGKRRVHLSESTLARQSSLAYSLHRLATHPEALLCR